MTPATRALDAAGVAYGVYAFEHVPATSDYGREAADAIGVGYDQVFKTLVVVVDGALGVGIVPVSTQMSMKLVASALGAKRAEMCDVTLAERTTGYVAGGISPVGQRRRLPTVIDETAELYDTIYVSGGRRGLDIGLAPADLIALVSAVVAPLTA